MSHKHHNHSHSSADQTPSQANREYYSSPDQIYLREKAFFEKFDANWTKEFLSLESWLNLNYRSSNIAPTPDSINTATGRKLRMLDYAPGPGMVSFAALQLKPSVDGQEARFERVLGVDVAEGMVALFNERVAAAQQDGKIKDGIEIGAYRGDLISSEVEVNSVKNDSTAPELDLKDGLFLPQSQGGGFDLVSCSLAVHHFPDPGFAIKQLASRLRKGGVLVICEILPPVDGEGGADQHAHHGHHHHDHPDQPGFDSNLHASTVPHQHGFTAVEMENLFKNAGLVEVKSRVMDLNIVMPESLGGVVRNMCLVVGRCSS